MSDESTTTKIKISVLNELKRLKSNSPMHSSISDVIEDSLKDTAYLYKLREENVKLRKVTIEQAIELSDLKAIENAPNAPAKVSRFGN